MGSELRGRSISDLVSPESLPGIMDRATQVMASGEPLEFEEHFDEVQRYYLVVVFPLGTELYAVLAVDITERKRLEVERDRLSSAIAQTHEAVVIADPRATILYANPAFERMTGYPAHEALGKNAGFCKAGELEPSFYRELWEIITRGEVWRGQFVNRKKNGLRYLEQATISPVRDPSGAITSYVAVKRDVTREVELEARQRLSQRLESVGRLAGGVAHDFNNMLTVILGMTDLALARKDLPGPLAADLADVRAAAVSASQLTRQLLTFARKQPAEPRIVELNEIVGGVLKMLRRVIGETIRLVWEPCEEPWLVRLDPAQLEQVLMNLALNARDAIDDSGSITIRTSNELVAVDRLSAQEVVPAGEYLVLSVHDTGHGMDGVVLDHAFEPFFTTKPKGKGTGLGLPIVYGIVKQSGGFVHVDSEPGHGTQFRIYLPRYDDGPPSQSDVDPLELEGGQETVLVVDDEPLILQFVGTALERMGYAVLTAGSPAEAMELHSAAGGKIRLLLTDVVMPGTSGVMLARELTARGPGLRVLLMSGYADEALLQADGLEFLPKPFSRSELIRKVRAVLDAPGEGRRG